MTSNPFDKHRAEPPGPTIGLREWCDEQNAKKITERMSRWYYVAKKDDAEFIDTLSGTDADCLRKMLAGKLDDFYGWPSQRMDGYRRWLWSCAEHGLIEPPRPPRSPANTYQQETPE